MNAAGPTESRPTESRQYQQDSNSGRVVDCSEFGDVAKLPQARTYHLGRWTVSVIVVLLAALFIRVLATNPNLDWGVVGEYLFNPTILAGVKNTIVITVLAQAIGIVGGLLLALARLSANPVLRGGAGLYIWLFRGVPVLVQLIFWFNLGLVFPTLTVQVPWTSITVFSVPTNSMITPFVAVLLGLGLNEMAYMAEVIRGGLLGVPPGQREAAASLGMTPLQTLRKVTLPQAARQIIPPTSNQLIIMLKISALASVVTYQDLLTSAQLIYSVNLRTLELLVVASIWYVALTTVCTLGQSALERRMGRSTMISPRSQPGAMSRLLMARATR
ncbi:amino acid ABC transporter permease [Mycolicibacterium austroafricanum]|uniref:Amino acid ABC transporter permease n=1 Tax=Mycolicibacterium austroafricanum TaxID=39687 RepID=A0ABT8HAE3_MYCAO|nr:amino acid ABC transporter permease [Mycolicibacterium austroafricanum]MDN4517739.1 amino acid ABC transporter permease [Mycolicibacterium austroafricanum]PQP45708.1 ABC transporter permease [Mycolicibacterium austroafricanum]QRZ08872.1 amino acid ABC transporter permease [Mycolicibacterium austroafricanum]QZT64256.1 amino acid ABC transporter permease [Mycolicibacterium austroafricanum]QZT70647.1 amino acid ABC transporter permease [Mycolicibacterium austroafricanum]